MVGSARLGSRRAGARARLAPASSRPYGIRSFDGHQIAKTIGAGKPRAQGRARHVDVAAAAGSDGALAAGHGRAAARAGGDLTMRRSFAGVRLRLCAAGIFFVAFFLTVALRAFQLQIVDGEKLRQLGEKQHLKEMIVLPKRGTIVDRAGEPLALSLEGQSVYARPRRIKEPKSVAPALAQALGVEAAEVTQKLVSDKSFVWLKRQVSPKEVERVEMLNIDGIGMYVEPNRYYPQGQLAAQIVGFVGRDAQGLEGV